MTVLHSIPELAALPGPVVLAIGVFDGVHLGHRAVIRRAIDDAAACGGTAAALTFDPHPARVLRPDAAPRLLTATAHKIRLLDGLGLDALLVVRFDATFAATPPDAFIRALHDAARPLWEICVGHQWTFGRGRAGNVGLLAQLGVQLGFRVAEVASVTADGGTVSSTRIRRAIECGDFETARRCLGREYAILGTVTRGAQLGRKLGFPTANLRAHNEQFPPDGVYAVRVEVEGRQFAGVANIGFRPTVSKTAGRLLEVHVFDFDEDLYGRDVEVTFVRLLREERKFDSLDALREQIVRDANEARSWLSA
jgi:riboflavin kinase/FMN adenylyltransferase